MSAANAIEVFRLTETLPDGRNRYLRELLRPDTDGSFVTVRPGEFLASSDRRIDELETRIFRDEEAAVRTSIIGAANRRINRDQAQALLNDQLLIRQQCFTVLRGKLQNLRPRWLTADELTAALAVIENELGKVFDETSVVLPPDGDSWPAPEVGDDVRTAAAKREQAAELARAGLDELAQREKGLRIDKERAAMAAFAAR